MIYLVKLVRSLLANSQTKTADFKNYLGSPIPHSMFLYSVSVAEILNVISKLKNSNSTGYDGYNTKFIKLSAPLLAPALVKIFNLSINTGVYPSSLKIAKVIPFSKMDAKAQ